MATSNNSSVNPLLQPSPLRHGAFPFNLLTTEHFAPALDQGIANAKSNLDRIRNASDAATFENTIYALESSGEDVGRVASIFYSLFSAESNDAIQALARELSPKLADFSSDILLDEKIFARVKSVWDRRLELKLSGEELRLTEKTYKDFARNGAILNATQKERLREIDQELARISPEYAENNLKADNAFQLVLEKDSDLLGLPEGAVEAAAQAAKEKGLDGKWIFTLHAPSYIPFVTYSEKRELREKLWRARESRCYKDAFTNEEIAKKLATLRHQRAVLLGYPTHAHFVLEERMAESPDKVRTFLERLLEKALPSAERDLAQVKALKAQETGDSDVRPWDYAFWSEKLKMKLHDLDDEVLRPYFKLENVINGVFEHATRLYGLHFNEVKDIPVYNPDVKVYEVVDDAKKFIGLFYADFFPRPSKQGGAWATTLRDQGMQNGKIERPHSSIVCNFPKSTPTKPSLLTIDDVRTLFHEFGHALHSLLSDCKYVSLGGTNVYWDFVELPSQIMENWALEQEGLSLFARHYQTDEPMPSVLIEKIKATAKFQAGWMTIRQIRFALLDFAWHANDPSRIEDLAAFEREATERTSLLTPEPGTNSSVSFSHIFAGGYSAGYYSYKWAEVLDADAFEYFKEKGLFNKEVAKSFRDNVLSKGGTRHPMELYKAFRGREPDPDALLRRDGLI
ncbi:MAG: M3 family metallopeptidase [Bdellovibrionota bacterium]